MSGSMAGTARRRKAGAAASIIIRTRPTRTSTGAGRAVPEPLDNRWWRRNVPGHLDTLHVRHGRDVDLRYHHAGPHLRDVERAPPALRDPDPQGLQLGHLRHADRS